MAEKSVEEEGLGGKSWDRWGGCGTQIRGCSRNEILAGLKTRGHMGWALFGDGGVGGELGAETPLQFLAEISDLHAGHDDEFAGEHFARFVIVGKLTDDAAVLAILIPTKTAIGDGFGTDELKAAEQRIALRDLELFPHDDDIDELFVRTKGFRHDEALSFANGAE